LNTTFQPNATKATFVLYSVRVAAALTISGGALGRVELRSDAGSPPTTVRSRLAGGSTGTVVVGISLTDTVEGVLSYVVPAGDNVNLTTIAEVGVPVFTLVAVTEIPVG
jgi:hypothetical protein